MKRPARQRKGRKRAPAQGINRQKPRRRHRPPTSLQAGMGQQFSWEEAEAAGEMDVAELQEWYKKFVVECPSGSLFMHEFKRFFKVTGNEEATQYVEGMFRAFDKNGVRP